jgi:uncharacterized protein YjbI with pentapeptide repeats
MKITTQQIQQIIKEELNLILYEVKGLPKGITVRSLIPKIIKALKSKKLEPIDLARINHLFKFFLRGDESEVQFAKKWIESFYKDFPEFKKIVDSDINLTYALNASPEFISTQKDISDTSYTPTGITTPDLFNYKKYSKTLRKKDLRDADLKGANLSGKNLMYADLRGANLKGANLSGAYLRYANLYDAYLSEANLSGADLVGADLGLAYLHEANLRHANLRGAKLSYTDLRYANLEFADLSGCRLSGTDLRYANLGYANLRGVKYTREANLIGAYLHKANLEGGEYDLTVDLPSEYEKEILDQMKYTDGKFFPFRGWYTTTWKSGKHWAEKV